MRDLLSMVWRAMSVAFVSLRSGSTTAPRCACPNPGFSCCSMHTNGSLAGRPTYQRVTQHPPHRCFHNSGGKTSPDSRLLSGSPSLALPLDQPRPFACALGPNPIFPLWRIAYRVARWFATKVCSSSLRLALTDLPTTGNTHELQPTQPKLCATARC
ncbi:hypothetical protein B0H10DRAFT_2107335 [Mycena sp. CBHHK59/15]|nr:hypothetical protein B0H10DRAFT_2107335 [Mycena sp. CBHHK59/15]